MELYQKIKPEKGKNYDFNTSSQLQGKESDQERRKFGRKLFSHVYTNVHINNLIKFVSSKDYNEPSLFAGDHVYRLQVSK